MAKRVKAILRLQLPAGSATPAPPVGPALGQHGINIMGFVKEYNARTAKQAGTIIPVHLTVFEDRSFSFVIKTPPASDLLRKAASIDKGSGVSGKEIVGKINHSVVKEIAQQKMQDLNATTLDGAVKIIEGTARSMGIEVSKE